MLRYQIPQTTKEGFMQLLRMTMALLAISLLLLLGCEKQPPVSLEKSQTTVGTTVGESEPIARELVGLSGWEVEQDEVTAQAQPLGKGQGFLFVSDFERQPIARNIVHYKCRVRVGAGERNVIGIHRVVKEKAPCVPIKTSDVFFYQHGDAKDFEGMMLPGTRGSNTPIDFGLAVFLAENNIDVWGIDQAWTLVPEGTTNFAFMKDWGMQKIVNDLKLAVAVARATRLLTGQGASQVVLSGYSSGVPPTVALLNEETQMPHALRQVRGYVPVDCAIRIYDSPLRDAFWAESQATQANHNAGQYQVDIPFRTVGRPARNDPDGPSPIIPGSTNLQAALIIVAGPAAPPATYHYFSGVLDADGTPTALRLTTLPRCLDFLIAGTPYESGLFIAEYEAMLVGIGGFQFNNHFSQITVPVFNIAAKGGIGDLTEQGLSLLGSKDIQKHMVAIPDPNINAEFGHVDLFSATVAPVKVWQPILNWLKTHRN
jgi:hypothetical protein